MKTVPAQNAGELFAPLRTESWTVRKDASQAARDATISDWQRAEGAEMSAPLFKDAAEEQAEEKAIWVAMEKGLFLEEEQTAADVAHLVAWVDGEEKAGRAPTYDAIAAEMERYVYCENTMLTYDQAEAAARTRKGL